MRWRLRTKLLLSFGVTLVVVFVVMTGLYRQYIQRSYLDALTLVAWSPGNYLAAQLQTFPSVHDAQAQAALATMIPQCLSLYQIDEKHPISFVAIVDDAGVFVAHSVPEQVNQLLPTALASHFKQRNQLPILHGDTYHLLIPVFQASTEYLATVVIGIRKQAVTQPLQTIFGQSFLFLGGLFLLALLGIAVLLHRLIALPIGRLVKVGEHLATGQLVPSFETVGGGNDELSLVGRAFHRMAAYLHHVADMASAISTGVLQGDIQLRSGQDVVGQALSKMLDYLKYIARLATRVAEGDLTESVQLRSANDRFGQAIQSMITGLRMLIEQIHQSTEHMTSTGESIASLATHDQRVVQDVHTSIEMMVGTLQKLGESVQMVVQDMEHLSASVQDSSDSVLLLTSSITLIASNAEELTTRSQLTIEALKHAVQGIEDVVENTDKSAKLSQLTIQDALAGQHAFEQVMQSMTTIQQTITTAVDSIAIFAQRSKEIDTILDVIREITERTTLLALNAAIIAAQAGVHGRGFAVVAEEIKNLADGVNISTKNIATIVHDLQKDTNKVVDTIHEGAENVQQGMGRTQLAKETLHKIIDSAQRSSSVATEIADALHDVMLTGRHVVDAMQEVGAMTEDFTSVTSEQEMNTGQINKAISTINTMTAQVSQETTEQLAAIQEAFDATQHISTLSGQSLESSQQIVTTTQSLAEQAEVLRRAVERFKLKSAA
jgi:methyl-accepting chemotaxis protein